MVAHHHRPLGKHAARHDARTLNLARYMAGTAPVPPPASVKWSDKTNKKWPMYMNDELGCCTCASAAHMIETWTAARGRGKEVEVSNAAVLAAYKTVGHYNPHDPSTDQGANMLDVLNHWRKNGIGGHKIGAFVSVSPKSSVLVQDGIYLVGGVYVGVGLPLSAQNQDVWDVVPGKQGEANSWGGHAICIIDYDPRGLTCVTWGALKRMTWPFFNRYCDEAYAILSNDFLNAKKAPNGFDLATLKADLAALSR
jgi:hypothetical protein